MLIRCPECNYLGPRDHYTTCASDTSPVPTRRSTYVKPRFRIRWASLAASLFTGVALGGMAVWGLNIATEDVAKTTHSECEAASRAYVDALIAAYHESLVSYQADIKWSDLSTAEVLSTTAPAELEYVTECA